MDSEGPDETPVIGDPEADREEMPDMEDSPTEPELEPAAPEADEAAVDTDEAAPDADEPLLDLQAAVAQIPEDLRKEMADLLRADFREVIRWKPPRPNTPPG